MDNFEDRTVKVGRITNEQLFNEPPDGAEVSSCTVYTNKRIERINDLEEILSTLTVNLIYKYSWNSGWISLTTDLYHIQRLNSRKVIIPFVIYNNNNNTCADISKT